MEKKPSLNTIGILHNTDKSSAGRLNRESKEREGCHSYLFAYQHFLNSCYRAYTASNSDRPFRLLELGAGPQWNQGASARTFRDYLPADSEIYVVDISSECLEPLNNIDNVITILADLGSTENFRYINMDLLTL